MKYFTMLKRLIYFALGIAALVTSIGCSPQQISKADENTQEPSALEFKWSSDSNCAICHAVQSASMDDTACLVSLHTGQLKCFSCHEDVTALELAHSDVALSGEIMVKRLKDTAIDDTLCQSCHGSHELLLEKTSDCLVLTDSNGRIVNPHNLPDNEEHGDITCVSCHSMHSKSDVNQTAKNLCASCHHKGVYACFTCHA